MLGLSVIILFKSLLHVFCSLVFSAHNSSVWHIWIGRKDNCCISVVWIHPSKLNIYILKIPHIRERINFSKNAYFAKNRNVSLPKYFCWWEKYSGWLENYFGSWERYSVWWEISAVLVFVLPIFVASYVCSSYVCASYICSFLGPVLPVKWGGTPTLVEMS